MAHHTLNWILIDSSQSKLPPHLSRPHRGRLTVGEYKRCAHFLGRVAHGAGSCGTFEHEHPRRLAETPRGTVSASPARAQRDHARILATACHARRARCLGWTRARATRETPRGVGRAWRLEPAGRLTLLRAMSRARASTPVTDARPARSVALHRLPHGCDGTTGPGCAHIARHQPRRQSRHQFSRRFAAAVCLPTRCFTSRERMNKIPQPRRPHSCALALLDLPI